MMLLEPIWLTRVSFGCLLTGLVFWLACTDIRRMILPNRLNVALAVGGLGQAAVLGQPIVTDALLGALLGGGTLALLAGVFWHVRGVEGIGLGDQKFVAAAALWIGWQEVTTMLLIAAMSALACVLVIRLSGRMVGRSTRLPFGPFLGFGTVATWVAATAFP